MNKLNVTLSGNGKTLELRNPVLTASGTFGYGTEFTPFGELRRLGGIVLKGISLHPRQGNPMPRIAETPCGMLNAVGLQNCGLTAFLERKLPALEGQDVPVIANLYATSAPEFAELAGRLADDGRVAALEVNISCPNVREGGVAFGQVPSMAAEVTRAVCRTAGQLPVIVKLSPNVTDITAVARACEDAGANMLSCINTLTGMAVDLNTRKPLLANVVGGLSGPAVKPVALRCVWQVSRSVDIPVIGVGGIGSAEDVLEFILAGAHAVQIGTASFLRPDAAFSIVRDLPGATEKYGVTSWASWRGALDA